MMTTTLVISRRQRRRQGRQARGHPYGLRSISALRKFTPQDSLAPRLRIAWLGESNRDLRSLDSPSRSCFCDRVSNSRDSLSLMSASSNRQRLLEIPDFDEQSTALSLALYVSSFLWRAHVLSCRASLHLARPRNRCPSGWPRRFFPFLVDSAAAWLLEFSGILPQLHDWSQMQRCGYPSVAPRANSGIKFGLAHRRSTCPSSLLVDSFQLNRTLTFRWSASVQRGVVQISVHLRHSQIVRIGRISRIRASSIADGVPFPKSDSDRLRQPGRSLQVTRCDRGIRDSRNNRAQYCRRTVPMTNVTATTNVTRLLEQPSNVHSPFED